ncbi:unnamed protein product [Polarella glacialis]|uniref:Sodium/calcium exchanger membrane region domain-containing protein n=2 Tax=Polarella glacialis TaxID=89957 RepID=A0A813FKY7_POLGL|nr:unnamed protein product [Polarella glacialis]
MEDACEAGQLESTLRQALEGHAGNVQVTGTLASAVELSSDETADPGAVPTAVSTAVEPDVELEGVKSSLAHLLIEAAQSGALQSAFQDVAKQRDPAAEAPSPVLGPESRVQECPEQPQAEETQEVTPAEVAHLEAELSVMMEEQQSLHETVGKLSAQIEDLVRTNQHAQANGHSQLLVNGQERGQGVKGLRRTHANLRICAPVLRAPEKMASLMQAQNSLRRSSSKLGGRPSPRDYTAVPTQGPDGEVELHHAPKSDLEGFAKIFGENKILTCLLLALPCGIAAKHMEMGDTVVFSSCFVAVIPLAWLIGKATEDVAARIGETAGGLLNATFGNVVEMLLCIAGIRNNEIVVVQCTLLGSILSNLLLVMGCAFLFGGMYYPIQKYNQAGASTQCSLMALSVFAIGLPTIYVNVLKQESEWEHMVEVSRWASICLLGVYFAYLVFQLKTHASLFQDESGTPEEEEESPDLSPMTAAILLAAESWFCSKFDVCTVATSFATDYLIDALKGTVEQWQVSKESIPQIRVLPAETLRIDGNLRVVIYMSRLSTSARARAQDPKMQNDEGRIVDLYLPRKCSATNRLIPAKEHGSVQLNVGQVDEDGRYTGEFYTFALAGFIRNRGESDACLNRLLFEKSLLTFSK